MQGGQAPTERESMTSTTIAAWIFGFCAATIFWFWVAILWA